VNNFGFVRHSDTGRNGFHKAICASAMSDNADSRVSRDFGA
jgi:hypothetical protein